MDHSRIFEYTEEYMRGRFSANGNIDLDSLARLPCLFMQETWHDGSQQNARVGSIIKAIKSGKSVKMEYAFDDTVPPLTNKQLELVKGEFGISDFEFSRTHWAVKDIDLYKVLIRYLKPRRQLPSVLLESRARLLFKNPLPEIKSLVPDIPEIRSIHLLTVANRLRDFARSPAQEGPQIDQP